MVMWKVWEIMRKGIATIESEKTATYAAKKMADLGFGSLLVMQKGSIVGIVTERDLLTKVLAKELDPNKIRLEDMMSQPVITIEASAELGNASKLMSEKGIRRLLVMHRSMPVGIVTTVDITNYLAKVHLFETVSHNGQEKEVQILHS